MAGLVISQVRNFKGRLLFSGLLGAPLVMPEVITGLSLLYSLEFARTIGWPGSRGASTITLAHITFSMAYVAVIIQSRLTDMDHSLAQAALDLGAKPHQVLIDITIPIIAPAMISGWLLSFTLSLDDLVIASFTSGAGAIRFRWLFFQK